MLPLQVAIKFSLILASVCYSYLSLVGPIFTFTFLFHLITCHTLAFFSDYWSLQTLHLAQVSQKEIIGELHQHFITFLWSQRERIPHFLANKGGRVWKNEHKNSNTLRPCQSSIEVPTCAYFLLYFWKFLLVMKSNPHSAWPTQHNSVTQPQPQKITQTLL